MLTWRVPHTFQGARNFRPGPILARHALLPMADGGDARARSWETVRPVPRTRAARLWAEARPLDRGTDAASRPSRAEHSVPHHGGTIDQEISRVGRLR